MSRRRPKRTGPPRCRDCDCLITFKRGPATNDWRPFEPKPVDGRRHVGALAYPVENGRAWYLEAFIDELMGRSAQSRDDATDEAYAFPFYVPHRCRSTPYDTEGDR